MYVNLNQELKITFYYIFNIYYSGSWPL